MPDRCSVEIFHRPRVADAHPQDSHNMKVCIVGCGAVGSLFEAHLAKAGEAEVWAYDVWKQHVAAIQKHGLRIYGGAELTARFNTSSEQRQLPNGADVICGTQAVHTKTAREQREQ